MRSWKTPAELQSDKSFHDWAAKRLERSIFHKQDALSTLVNRCNCVNVWKRSSYYSNHKKKIATAVGPKRPLGQRSSNNHHSVVSSPILATRHLRLDKRMIFPMMLLNKQCNEKWKKLWSFKEVCTKRGASLEWSYDSRDSTNDKRRSLVGSQTAGVARSYTEVTWCKFMQARASFEACSVTTTGRAKARRQGWAPETRDHLPRDRYRLLVSLQNNRLLRS